MGVTFGELKACVESVARGCRGCPNCGSVCSRCDRQQCRMLASRFADETENPEKKMWVPYAGRVFAAGQVLRLGKSAYPDGMPCKSCGKCGEKGGCEAYPIKARCKDYRVWVKAERAKAAAGKRVAE